ncbi:hypothetical protein DY000_02028460 [Brassica cretica]|uniref:Uncharacterized protein n=1 Tax=Brassica cretica TaxID=69181 RepID=A0ABQ7DLG9_BRACR|nr:hypothetical protein DY000_02028460 [Brassica cretica]
MFPQRMLRRVLLACKFIRRKTDSLIQKKKNEKDDGPIGIALLGHCGIGRRRPVILPPSRAGGVRCSVKPASRSLPHSKKYVTKAYAEAACFNSQLGMGKP